MKTLFYKKKFLLNQTTEKLDPKLEIATLEWLLKRMEKEEKYEMATVVNRRLEQIISTET